MAQATTAVLGQIPVHTLAYGVEVDGYDVRVRFQLTEVSERDQEDMDETVGDFEMLVGSAVNVECVHEFLRERVPSRHGRVRWIYLSRVGDETYGQPDPEIDTGVEAPPGEVSALMARALVQASEVPLSVQDVDELIERSLQVHHQALRRSLGTGVISELVLSGYIEVILPDGVELDGDSEWDRVKALWSRWKTHNPYPPDYHLIASLPLTRAGWDAAIRIGSSSGTREFVWDGEPYASRGRRRLVDD